MEYFCNFYCSSLDNSVDYDIFFLIFTIIFDMYRYKLLNAYFGILFNNRKYLKHNSLSNIHV